MTKALLIITVTQISLGIANLAQAKVEILVDGLDNESYHFREDSEQKLAVWAKSKGKEGIKILSGFKKRSTSPEVKSRLSNVISGIVLYEARPNTKGFIGISMEARMGEMIIIMVSPNTPAEKFGLKVRDVIIAVDDVDLSLKKKHKLEARNFFMDYVKRKKAGEKLTLKIMREGNVLEKKLKLADYEKFMGFDSPKIGQNELLLKGLQLRVRPGGGDLLKIQRLLIEEHKKRLDKKLREQLEELDNQNRLLLDKLKK